MATEKTAHNVEIPELRLNHFTLNIVGTSPLISHAWSQKAKMEMLGKQLKKAATAKEARRPPIEFADSLYWLTEKPDFTGLTDDEVQSLLAEVIPKSKFGFPVLAFKSAALDAGYQQGALVRNAGSSDLAKTTARGAFFVTGEAGDFVVIDGTPTPREDIARIGKGMPEVRFRAEFKTWRTKLFIKFNERVITPSQIANLFRLGGFANGVGDWRPAKDGSFGTFEIC